MNYKYFSFAILLFSFLTCCENDNTIKPDITKPVILSVTENSGGIGDEIRIDGTGFGEIRGTSMVYFSGLEANDYTIWETTSIIVRVPPGAESGKVWVDVNGVKSNEVDFTVTFQPEVTIGTQIWMTKNLDVDHYRNGDSIPEVRDSLEWANLKTGAWCYYNNDPAMGKIYGKLYNWYAVIDPRGLAPEGWHVPSDSEWTDLENYLIFNGYDYEGKTRGYFAKSLATASGWQSDTSKGAVGNTDYPSKRNATGFSALPAGFCSSGKSFIGIGGTCGWWTTTEYSAKTTWAKRREMHYYAQAITTGIYVKEYGYSVRCVKD